MAPSTRWLVLCLITQLHLILAQTNASTIFIPEANTIIGINLPDDGSNDINFYVSSPDWYQYSAIGFGSSMANSLILVIYPSADHRSVTVSPRFTDGNTEPTHQPLKITLHSGTELSPTTGQMTANGTCHGCRNLHTTSRDSNSIASQKDAIPSDVQTAPVMFAVGPNSGAFSSDDLDARIRRHVAHGIFNIDIAKSTGPGGVGTPTNVTQHVSFPDDDSSLKKSSNKAATAHGILFAIVALAIAPFDTLVAAFLGRRWPKLHVVTGSTYFLFVLGAMIPGIVISREHILTAKMGTGHQVLGLLTVAVMFVMVVWGFVVRRTQGAGGPAGGWMKQVHAWGGRGIWVALLINNGLGLKLSEQTKLLMLGYAVLAGGVFVFLIPIYFCMWRCTSARKPKTTIEEDHELYNMPSIYDHEARYGYGRQ
ncbi:hypothetical protein QBC40DRAFT_276694 [Triangularia verruculosa]|uniref:DOMON domain-containing protein n=1 Tax=Triangularia verruculosa TaxID=2587418 RepID=A0AAN6XL81_9PEZI|nr:hypothetical protein QBC40DRAFT_276694 [Triangularia verruculosa]